MKVIAKKKRSNPSNPNLGYLEPMLKFDEREGKFVSVDRGDFPNDGEIFIIKSYDILDQDFHEGELFLVEDIKVNETSYDKDRVGSCYYTATNSNVHRISKWKYLPIYEGDIDFERRSAKNISSIENGLAFFVKNGNHIFGPFTNDIVTLSAITTEYFDFESGDIDEETIIVEYLLDKQDFISKYNVDTISNAISSGYVTDLTILYQTSPEEVIYFGSKEKLIEWGKKTFSAKLNLSERSILDKIKDNIVIPELSSQADRQKIELFKKYIGETGTWLNIELPKYFDEYLSSESGSTYVVKFLEDNKESFFAKYRQDEIAEKDLNIRQKTEQLEELTQRMKEIEGHLANKEDEVFKQVPDDQKVKIKEIILNLETRDLLLKYYDENQSIENLREELIKLKGTNEYLDGEIKDKESKRSTLEKAIKNIKSEIFDEKEFAKKVIDAKIYTDLLNNIDPSQSGNSEDTSINLKPVSINRSEFSSKQFVEEILLRLEKNNRKVSYNDLVNYLVLINQNFLTVFAGLPGVGKTSLVEKLATVMGLVANDRYLKIPVARGWTSSKDLIGYFNPLTKKYQSSKTELYGFLKRCEADVKKSLEVPSIVLLDEANLSPMEHYWSDFLTLSDFDYSRVVKTMDSENIQFGQGLRFIATINYDHTTELLSDRLISRAPIVRLHSLEYTIEESSSGEEFRVSDALSQVQFNNYLNRGSQRDYFKGDVKNKFDSIVKTLQEDDNGWGQPIIIGMRKYRAVERFCSVAGALMEDQNKFTALDYAVNQYILPLINGRGDSYAKRLIELKERLQGLPQSLSCVTKIIKIGGDNFKNYKFFS